MRRLSVYLAVAAAVALAGCHSSKTGTPASTATTSTPAATVSPCATAQLAASLGQENGTAGTRYYPVIARPDGFGDTRDRGGRKLPRRLQYDSGQRPASNLAGSDRFPRDRSRRHRVR
jgi:hypothetical protein